MTAVMPKSLEEHQPKYLADAWRLYSLAELGNTVAFFIKRATHRLKPEQAAKDVQDAQNYLDMMQAHVNDAKAKLSA